MRRVRPQPERASPWTASLIACALVGAVLALAWATRPQPPAPAAVIEAIDLTFTREALAGPPVGFETGPAQPEPPEARPES